MYCVGDITERRNGPEGKEETKGERSRKGRAGGDLVLYSKSLSQNFKNYSLYNYQTVKCDLIIQ